MPFIAFVVAGIATATPGLGQAWAEMSRRPALRRFAERVEIGTLGYDRERRMLHYWLRREVDQGGRKSVTWADSRDCTAVRPLLSSMRQIALPRPAPYGFDEGGEITLDGVGYMLRTPARFGLAEGEITIRSNVNTPLAEWVEASMLALADCWTGTPPKRVVR